MRSVRRKEYVEAHEKREAEEDLLLSLRGWCVNVVALRLLRARDPHSVGERPSRALQSLQPVV